MEEQKEYWKFVKGNKRYKVSTLGNIYDLYNDVMLKQYINKNGYCYVYFKKINV